ncbi:hypothetical protein Tco_1567804, partial [Tanacetum coccineum]
MAVPNIERTRYTKETIRVEYEWEPPRCSTCLIFSHSLDDCPKAPKRVVNGKDKCKGQTSRADDEGFIEVKSKKSGGNSGGKNFKPVSVKQKTLYHPKAVNSFEALNVKNPIIEEVATGYKATTSGTQEEGKRSTL